MNKNILKFSRGGVKAFTLAEVLITLVIIGVIAAMTVPSLMNNTNKKENIVRYKKAISTINQALNRNYALYGFNMASVDENCRSESNDTPDAIMSVCSIFNTTLLRINSYDYSTLKTENGKLYYSELYSKGTAPDTQIKERGVQLYFYQMVTGGLFAFHSPHKGNNTIPACTMTGRTLQQALKDPEFQKYCVAWVDINGVKPPNKEVRCSDGKAHYGESMDSCTVNLKDITDVFPIALYDSSAVPASAAASKVVGMF